MTQAAWYGEWGIRIGIILGLWIITYAYSFLSAKDNQGYNILDFAILATAHAIYQLIFEPKNITHQDYFIYLAVGKTLLLLTFISIIGKFIKDLKVAQDNHIYEGILKDYSKNVAVLDPLKAVASKVVSLNLLWFGNLKKSERDIFIAFLKLINPQYALEDKKQIYLPRKTRNLYRILFTLLLILTILISSFPIEKPPVGAFFW